MCTIDPLNCWYYDHLDYWIKHPQDLEMAEDAMKAGFPGCGLFADNYARMGERLEKLTTK